MTEALTVDAVDSAGEKTDSVELPAEVFNAPLNISLMYQVIVGQPITACQGTHITKARGDIHGGGRKPCRQKDTGRARQGLTRAPQFVGGSTVHSSQLRDYNQRISKKMKIAALRGALSGRARNGRVHVITELIATTVPSIENALVVLCNLIDHKALAIVDHQDGLSRLSLRNVPEAHVLWADQFNIYNIPKSNDVVFTASDLDVLLSKDEEEPK